MYKYILICVCYFDSVWWGHFNLMNNASIFQLNLNLISGPLSVWLMLCHSMAWLLWYCEYHSSSLIHQKKKKSKWPNRALSLTARIQKRGHYCKYHIQCVCVCVFLCSMFVMNKNKILPCTRYSKKELHVRLRPKMRKYFLSRLYRIDYIIWNY